MLKVLKGAWQMFNPNNKTEIGSSKQYSHRSDEFHQLMIDLEMTFKQKFGLQGWKIVFVTGSGTLVNEMVLRGFKKRFLIYNSGGKFAKRLVELNKSFINDEPHDYCAYTLYETSTSFSNPISTIPFELASDLLFADMISAFPYYDVPDEIDIFTCVSGKQLGGYPGIGIIAMRSKCYAELADPVESYMSLGHWVNWSDTKHETPYTPAIALYADLLERLKGFDLQGFRNTINGRRMSLTNNLPKNYVVGEGPVLSITKNGLDSLLRKSLIDDLDLYETPDLYQVFLWSGIEELYSAFHNALYAATE